MRSAGSRSSSSRRSAPSAGSSLILGLVALDDGPRLHGDHRAGRRGDERGQLRLPGDHDRPDARGGPRDRPAIRSPGRPRRPASPSARRPSLGILASSRRSRVRPRRPAPYALPRRRSTPLELALPASSLVAVRLAASRSPGMSGLGPLRRRPAPDDPVAPDRTCAHRRRTAGCGPGRARPADRLGWSSASRSCPIVVYVISYIPWAALGNQLVDGLPAGAHRLQDAARADRARCTTTTTACARPHPASSPWWAWPFDLKPVWFYQERLRQRHDGRHLRRRQPRRLVAGDPGHGLRRLAGVAAAQPGARRSIFDRLRGQWMPWSRIDRATFQYHYYTSLPFLLIALAYFLAELWHGPSTADLARWPGSRPRSRSSGRPCCGCSRRPLCGVRPGHGREPGLRGLRGDGIPARSCSRWRSAGLVAVAPRGRRVLLVQLAAARRDRDDQPGEADRRIRCRSALTAGDRRWSGSLVVGAVPARHRGLSSRSAFRIEPIALVVLARAAAGRLA